VAGQLGLIDADARLEPLPILVGQRDGGDRQIEQPARQARDAIEGFARRRVQETELTQGAQPVFFALRRH
jgi:hypothetical protein